MYATSRDSFYFSAALLKGDAIFENPPEGVLGSPQEAAKSAPSLWARNRICLQIGSEIDPSQCFHYDS